MPFLPVMASTTSSANACACRRNAAPLYERERIVLSAETVHDAAHDVAGAAAADLILRRVGRHEREALNVKVKFQNFRDFAAKAFNGNRNRLGVAEAGNRPRDGNFILIILTAGQSDGKDGK